MYDCISSYRARTPYIKTSRCVPALRQPQRHAQRHPQEKLEIVQLWRCASCKRKFTPGPAALHNKTYPLRMILSALQDYDLGYSLAQTAARLKKKTNRSVSPSTITA